MSFAAYRDAIFRDADVAPATADLTGLEDSARQHLTEGPFGFVAGGAGSGATVRANREAFDRWRIVPRTMPGVAAPRLSRSVLGIEMPAPVLLAPVGLQSVVHPDGEPATARAAAALGVPMVVSTSASYCLEDVAKAGGPRWFQLYQPNDDDVCVSLLNRARTAGYTVLVVTVDGWTMGWRPRDLDHADLPFLRGLGTANAFADPVFQAKLTGSAVAHWQRLFTNTPNSWDRLRVVRDNWAGPVVLKGIQHPADALRAADEGFDGIVVSNHGGRQVDGAIASLDALPGIVHAVGARIEVLFDSGVRTGADVVKALALGARAVLLGRQQVYGLAHGGETGVVHMLRSLLADLELTVGLAGYRSVDDLTPDTLTGIGPSVRRLP